MSTPKEPDYKVIAHKLLRQCEFALQKLKADGWTGVLLNTSGPAITSQHWKERMADVMELVPGVKVDREMMHVCSLPKKQREKEMARIDAERKAAKEPAQPCT